MPKKRPFRVVWKIDLDALNPRDAAEKALTIMRDPLSTATVFDVYEESGHHRIDLLYEKETSR